MKRVRFRPEALDKKPPVERIPRLVIEPVDSDATTPGNRDESILLLLADGKRHKLSGKSTCLALLQEPGIFWRKTDDLLRQIDHDSGKKTWHNNPNRTHVADTVFGSSFLPCQSSRESQYDSLRPRGEFWFDMAIAFDDLQSNHGTSS